MSVRRVDLLHDEGVLACLTGDDADLDDALMELAAHASDDPGSDTSAAWECDQPTAITSGAYHWRGEVEVGRFRKQPCICGGGHGWDLMPVPDGANPRGSFWGVLA